MISSHEWAQLRREIATQMMVILSGNTAATQIDNVVGTESINNSPPGMPTIESRPVAHPYGMVSRAPKDTVQVVARQGDHPGNRIVLLHRDKDRPSLNAAGEVMMYDGFGNQVWMKDGKIVVKLDGTMELGDGATKEAARKTDEVTITITPDDVLTMALVGASGPVTASSPVTVTGTITQGSSKVKIAD